MALNPPIEGIPLPLREADRDEHIQRFLKSLPCFESRSGILVDQEEGEGNTAWDRREGEETGPRVSEVQDSIEEDSHQDRVRRVDQVEEREVEAALRREERKHRRREKAAILNPKLKPPTPPIPRPNSTPPKPGPTEIDDEWYEAHRRRRRASPEIPPSSTRKPALRGHHSYPSDGSSETMDRVKARIKSTKPRGNKGREKRTREPKGRIPGMDIIEAYKPFTSALTAPRITLKPMNSKKGMFANGKSSDPAVIRHLTGLGSQGIGMRRLLGSQSHSGPSDPRRMTLPSSPREEGRDWRDQWRRKDTGTEGGQLPPPGNTNSASWPSTLPSSDRSIQGGIRIPPRIPRQDGPGNQAAEREQSDRGRMEELRGRYMYNQHTGDGHGDEGRNTPNTNTPLPHFQPDVYTHPHHRPSTHLDRRNSQHRLFYPHPYRDTQQDPYPMELDQAQFQHHQPQAYHQDQGLEYPYHTEAYYHDVAHTHDLANQALNLSRHNQAQAGFKDQNAHDFQDGGQLQYSRIHNSTLQHGLEAAAVGTNVDMNLGRNELPVPDSISLNDFWKHERPRTPLAHSTTPLPRLLRSQVDFPLPIQTSAQPWLDRLQNTPITFPAPASTTNGIHFDRPDSRWQAHLNQPHPQQQPPKLGLEAQPYPPNMYSYVFPSEAYITPTPMALPHPRLIGPIEEEQEQELRFSDLGYYDTTLGSHHPPSRLGRVHLPSPVSMPFSRRPGDVSMNPVDVSTAQADGGRMNRDNQVAEYGATTDEWKDMWSSKKAYR